MICELLGLPFATIEFDENAKTVNRSEIADFFRLLLEKGSTDLFIFSHGWNNDRDTAMNLYNGVFGEIHRLLDAGSPSHTIAAAGVIWPSILWPDGASGGAVGLTGEFEEIESLMKSVFLSPKEQSLVSDLVKIVEQRDDDRLEEFREKLQALVAVGSESKSLDDGEARAVAMSPETLSTSELLGAAASLGSTDMPDENGGGAADFGSFAKGLWSGAKNLLRVTTYWKMKERAGLIGKNGLGPLLSSLKRAQPQLKIHLIGHSFGARLVSFALAGLDAELGASIGSLTLLQGAFSHFAFCSNLPFEPTRCGELKGMSARVSGPLIATFSTKDTAVGCAYPIASLLGRQDASAASDDPMYRWAGMGFDGAQAVDALSLPMLRPGETYDLKGSSWTNIDANDVFKNGGPPSGAHSDIIHPETAWLILSAAGCLEPARSIATAR